MTWIPAVVTIHDLSFLRFPERFRPANRLYLTTMTRLSCQRAQRIIAVSQATADETTRLLGVRAERIDVVYHGVEHSQFQPLPSDQVEAFRGEKGLPDRFVLFVGTLEPRKNLVTLVEAFSRTRAVRQGMRLFVAGGKGWYYQEVFRRVEELGLTQAVHFPGFVPDAELPLWYNAASVLVFPSEHEGFGLPVLESMACGTPVIAANTSSLPEVVGQAAFLYESTDLAQLIDHIANVLDDPYLMVKMQEMGRDQASKFSWQKAGQDMAAVYEKALSYR